MLQSDLLSLSYVGRMDFEAGSYPGCLGKRGGGTPWINCQLIFKDLAFSLKSDQFKYGSEVLLMNAGTCKAFLKQLCSF